MNELFWTAAGIILMGVTLGVGSIDTILFDFTQLSGQALNLVKLGTFVASLGCVWKVIN